MRSRFISIKIKNTKQYLKKKKILCRMADERQIVDDYSNSPSLNRNFSGPAVLSDSENMEFNHSFSQLQLTNELDSMIKTNEPHQENQNLDYMKPLSKIGLV